MSLYVLEAKDCLPFEIKGGNKKPIIVDTAMRQFCNYWYKTDGYSNDDDYLARMKTTQTFDSENPSTQWWAGRYIGIARLKVPSNSTFHRINISIRPRFGENFLLAILEDLYNIKIGQHDAIVTQSSEWFSSLLHLLQKRMWVEKCSKANRYGLPRTNVKREHQGATLRGALDVRRTIKPWLIKQEICSNTFEKVLDERICKIVYEAHRILSQNIVSQEKKKVKSPNSNVGFGFSMPPTVQDIINSLNAQFKGTQFGYKENDYQRIRYKSIYLSWKPLVDFSWSVIRGRQLGCSASDTQTECVFVDMAEIWESFLRKKLGEGLREDGWRVLSVEECRFEIYKGKFYQRDIIPDIILEHERDGLKEYMVFDAKYKRMRGVRANVKYSDVDRLDLFQIHTYIQFVQRHLGKVILGGLLYPISKKGINDDGTLYEYSESDVIDTTLYHSDNLFGVEGKDNSHKIPFIVDGIYCSENDNKDKLDSSVRAMINRIQDIIKKNTLNN